MEITQIYNTLIERGYDSRSAKLASADLVKLSEPLNSYLQAWIRNNTKENYELYNYSISLLENKYRMTYPAALLTMDWLIKEPEKAIGSLKQGIK